MPRTRYNHSVIGARQTTSAAAASGIFGLTDHQVLSGAGLFPKPEIFFTPASLIASSFWNTNGYSSAGAAVPVTIPTGTQVGDSVIIIQGYSGLDSNPSTTNKTGWTGTVYYNDTNYGYYGMIWRKLGIESGDLTGMTITPSATSTGNSFGTFAAITFRNLQTFNIQLNATLQSGTSSFSASGITKSGGSDFILSAVNDRSGGTLTAGAGWTQLGQTTALSSVFSLAVSYKASASYTSLDTIPWSRDFTTYTIGNWTIDAI
jgi:hypothetical protein